jgi:tetratricopeptide (TPR) repeat protein
VQKPRPPFASGYVPAAFLAALPREYTIERLGPLLAVRISATTRRLSRGPPIHYDDAWGLCIIVYSLRRRKYNKFEAALAKCLILALFWPIDSRIKSSNCLCTRLPSSVSSVRLVLPVSWKQYYQPFTRGSYGYSSVGAETNRESGPWEAGVAAYNVGNFAAAAVSFRSAGNGRNSKMNFNLAMSYRRLNMYPSAIFYFSLAIQQDRFFALAYFCRGVCYHESEDHLQALVECDFDFDFFFFFCFFPAALLITLYIS